MKKPKKKPNIKGEKTIFRRGVSLLLIVVLLISPGTVLPASAAPTVEQKQNSAINATPFLKPERLKIPKKLGSIDESFQGTNGKTIIYIQDAHDSLEAQENIAKMIDYWVEHAAVKTVFEEGYEGAVPTDTYFSDLKDPEIKEKVSYFLMDQLRLGGAEYAHVNRFHSGGREKSETQGHQRPRDFKLIGVDSLKLHKQNIERYQQTERYQEETVLELEEMLTRIHVLANQHFSKTLKEWMKLKEKLDRKELDLLGYLTRTQVLLLKGISHEEFQAHYPHISLLLAADKTKDPKLLKRVKTEVNYKVLFQEINSLEDDYADKQLGTAQALSSMTRDRQIFYDYKLLQLLNRLNAFEVTESEYAAVKAKLRGVDTLKIAKFIADETKGAVILSRRWEQNIQNAIDFYETAKKRDKTLDRQLESWGLSRERHNDNTSRNSQLKTQESAILVFGGFHKEHIKQTLRARGFSYYVVSPRISQVSQRHQDYYKHLMSVGYHPFETALGLVQTAVSPERIFTGPAVYNRTALNKLGVLYQSGHPASPTLAVRKIEEEAKGWRIDTKHERQDTRHRTQDARRGLAVGAQGRSEVRLSQAQVKELSRQILDATFPLQESVAKLLDPYMPKTAFSQDLYGGLINSVGPLTRMAEGWQENGSDNDGAIDFSRWIDPAILALDEGSQLLESILQSPADRFEINPLLVTAIESRIGVSNLPVELLRFIQNESGQLRETMETYPAWLPELQKMFKEAQGKLQAVVDQLPQRSEMRTELTQLLIKNYTGELAEDGGVAARAKAQRMGQLFEGAVQTTMGDLIYWHSKSGIKLVEISKAGSRRYFDEKGRWILTLDRFDNKIYELAWNKKGRFESLWAKNLNQRILIAKAGGDHFVRGIYSMDETLRKRLVFAPLGAGEKLDLNKASSIPQMAKVRDDEFSREDNAGMGTLIFNAFFQLAADQDLEPRYQKKYPLEGLFKTLLTVANPHDSQGRLASFSFFSSNPEKVRWTPTPIEFIHHPQSGFSVSSRGGDVLAVFNGEQWFLPDHQLQGPSREKNRPIFQRDSQGYYNLSMGKRFIAKIDPYGALRSEVRGERIDKGEGRSHTTQDSYAGAGWNESTRDAKARSEMRPSEYGEKTIVIDAKGQSFVNFKFPTEKVPNNEQVTGIILAMTTYGGIAKMPVRIEIGSSFYRMLRVIHSGSKSAVLYVQKMLEETKGSKPTALKITWKHPFQRARQKSINFQDIRRFFFDLAAQDSLVDELFARPLELFEEVPSMEMEYVQGRSFKDLPPHEKLIVLYRVVQKLSKIEKKYKVAFPDLHDQNIIVDDQGQPKIIDLDELSLYDGPEEIKDAHFVPKYRMIGLIGNMLLQAFEGNWVGQSWNLMVEERTVVDDISLFHREGPIRRPKDIPDAMMEIVMKAMMQHPQKQYYDSLESLTEDLEAALGPGAIEFRGSANNHGTESRSEMRSQLTRGQILAEAPVSLRPLVAAEKFRQVRNPETAAFLKGPPIFFQLKWGATLYPPMTEEIKREANIIEITDQELKALAEAVPQRVYGTDSRPAAEYHPAWGYPLVEVNALDLVTRILSSDRIQALLNARFILVSYKLPSTVDLSYKPESEKDSDYFPQKPWRALMLLHEALQADIFLSDYSKIFRSGAMRKVLGYYYGGGINPDHVSLNTFDSRTLYGAKYEFRIPEALLERPALFIHAPGDHNQLSLFDAFGRKTVDDIAERNAKNPELVRILSAEVLRLYREWKQSSASKQEVRSEMRAGPFQFKQNGYASFWEQTQTRHKKLRQLSQTLIHLTENFGFLTNAPEEKLEVLEKQFAALTFLTDSKSSSEELVRYYLGFMTLNTGKSTLETRGLRSAYLINLILSVAVARSGSKLKEYAAALNRQKTSSWVKAAEASHILIGPAGFSEAFPVFVRGLENFDVANGKAKEIADLFGRLSEALRKERLTIHEASALQGWLPEAHPELPTQVLVSDDYEKIIAWVTDFKEYPQAYLAKNGVELVEKENLLADGSARIIGRAGSGFKTRNLSSKRKGPIAPGRNMQEVWTFRLSDGREATAQRLDPLTRGTLEQIIDGAPSQAQRRGQQVIAVFYDRGEFYVVHAPPKNLRASTDERHAETIQFSDWSEFHVAVSMALEGWLVRFEVTPTGAVGELAAKGLQEIKGAVLAGFPGLKAEFFSTYEKTPDSSRKAGLIFIPEPIGRKDLEARLNALQAHVEDLSQNRMTMAALNIHDYRAAKNIQPAQPFRADQAHKKLAHSLNLVKLDQGQGPLKSIVFVPARSEMRSWSLNHHYNDNETRIIQQEAGAEGDSAIIFADGSLNEARFEDWSADLVMLAKSGPKRMIVVYNALNRETFTETKAAQFIKLFGIPNIHIVSGGLSDALKPYQFRENVSLIHYSGTEAEAVFIQASVSTWLTQKMTRFVGEPGSLGHGLKYLDAVKLKEQELAQLNRPPIALVAPGIEYRHGYYVVSPEASATMLILQKEQFAIAFAQAA